LPAHWYAFTLVKKGRVKKVWEKRENKKKVHSLNLVDTTPRLLNGPLPKTDYFWERKTEEEETLGFRKTTTKELVLRDRR